MKAYLNFLKKKGTPFSVDEECLNFDLPENIACTNEKNIAYNSDKNIACSVSKEELKVDNTDLYVPDGWQRQLFKLSGSNYLYRTT